MIMTEITDRQKFFPLAMIAVFVICVTASALLGNIILTGDVYAPAVHDLKALDLSEMVFYAADRLAPSAIQLTMILVSAYTAFPLYVSAAVCAYRGISFGYTASALAWDALVFHSENIKFSGIPASGAVMALYLLNTAMITLLAYFAVSRAEKANTKLKDEIRFIRVFLVISGGVFLCECAKLLLVCNL